METLPALYVCLQGNINQLQHITARSSASNADYMSKALSGHYCEYNRSTALVAGSCKPICSNAVAVAVGDVGSFCKPRRGVLSSCSFESGLLLSGISGQLEGSTLRFIFIIFLKDPSLHGCCLQTAAVYHFQLQDHNGRARLDKTSAHSS